MLNYYLFKISIYKIFYNVYFYLMCYFNKIYTYLNTYFKNCINLFIIKLLQHKKIIICFIILNSMSLKNLLIKVMTSSTLIIII